MEIARDTVSIAGGGTIPGHMGFGAVATENAAPNSGSVCIYESVDRERNGYCWSFKTPVFLGQTSLLVALDQLGRATVLFW